MGYSTLVAGTTITASWANANVRDQVVTPFATTGARDAAITSPVEGMVAAITGDDDLAMYTGSAWVSVGSYAWNSYDPAAIWGNAVNVTDTGRWRYDWAGDIVFEVDVSLSGAPTAGNFGFALPSTPANTRAALGVATFHDAGTGSYAGIAYSNTGSAAVLHVTPGTVNSYITATSPFTWASGDLIHIRGSYRPA